MTAFLTSLGILLVVYAVDPPLASFGWIGVGILAAEVGLLVEALRGD